MNRYHSIRDFRVRNRRRRDFIKHEIDMNISILGFKDEVSVLQQVETNNMRKKHPYSCSRKNCIICHYEKVFNIKKKIDLIEDYRAQEQLEEI